MGFNNCAKSKDFSSYPSMKKSLESTIIGDFIRIGDVLILGVIEYEIVS